MYTEIHNFLNGVKGVLLFYIFQPPCIIFAKDVHRKFMSDCKFCESRHSEIPHFFGDISEF